MTALEQRPDCPVARACNKPLRERSTSVGLAALSVAAFFACSAETSSVAHSDDGSPSGGRRASTPEVNPCGAGDSDCGDGGSDPTDEALAGAGGAAAGSGAMAAAGAPETLLTACEGLPFVFPGGAGSEPCVGAAQEAEPIPGERSDPGCNFVFPEAPSGFELDPTELELRMVYRRDGVVEEIPYLPSLDDCVESPVGGWSFNDSELTHISVCPCTCLHFVGGWVELRIPCGGGPAFK